MPAWPFGTDRRSGSGVSLLGATRAGGRQVLSFLSGSAASRRGLSDGDMP
jgi:hypothetical protein